MPVSNGFGNANFSVFFAGFSFRKIKRLSKKPPYTSLLAVAGVSRGWGGEMQSGSRSVWSAVAAVSLLSPAHVPMATSNGKVAELGAAQSAPDPSTRRSQDDVLAGELLLHQGGLRHQVQHHDQGQQGVVQGSGDKCWSWKASLLRNNKYLQDFKICSNCIIVAL